MQPHITIITICYNAATTISRTLRSVTAQTYPHIQYLVIDGASKDNTLELVRDLAPQAEVYSEPDKGIYDAMNKGLDRATGDYVWYVNAGDALPSPTTVEELVRATCSGTSLPDVLDLAQATPYDLRYRFSADVDWCIRVLKRAQVTAFYPQPIALYLNEGTTTANHRASLIERFHVMRRHYGLVMTILQHLRFLVDRKR